MNAALMAEITIEEASYAVFQLGATKAPGPNGLTGPLSLLRPSGPCHVATPLLWALPAA